MTHPRNDNRAWPDSVRTPNRMEVLHWLKPGTERPRCNIRRGFVSKVLLADEFSRVTCERCLHYTNLDKERAQ